MDAVGRVECCSPGGIGVDEPGLETPRGQAACVVRKGGALGKSRPAGPRAGPVPDGAVWWRKDAAGAGGCGVGAGVGVDETLT